MIARGRKREGDGRSNDEGMALYTLDSVSILRSLLYSFFASILPYSGAAAATAQQHKCGYPPFTLTREGLIELKCYVPACTHTNTQREGLHLHHHQGTNNNKTDYATLEDSIKTNAHTLAFGICTKCSCPIWALRGARGEKEKAACIAFYALRARIKTLIDAGKCWKYSKSKRKNWIKKCNYAKHINHIVVNQHAFERLLVFLTILNESIICSLQVPIDWLAWWTDCLFFDLNRLFRRLLYFDESEAFGIDWFWFRFVVQ